MNSFITWIGGKKVLRKLILEQFPKKEMFDRYIEVFGGAGWVLFSEEQLAKTEIYNDINGNLVNLFRCVKYHAGELQKELEYLLISREQFFDANAQMECIGMTDIQKAARFFCLIRESYGADLQSFGGKSFNIINAKEYLSYVSERLSRVVIENQDFEKIIKRYDREVALFYLDPPYYKAEKYYDDKFVLEDHLRLKAALDHIKGKFILSYNDCEFIRKLYSDYIIIEVNRENNLVNKATRPRYKELLIKNF